MEKVDEGEVITQDMMEDALKKTLKIFAMGCKVERKFWFPNSVVYKEVQQSDKPTKAYLDVLMILYVNFKIDPISGDYKVYNGDTREVVGPAKAAKLFRDNAINLDRKNLLINALRFLHCQLRCIFDEVNQANDFPKKDFEYFDRVVGGEKEVDGAKIVIQFRKVPKWDGGPKVQLLAKVIKEIWLVEGMQEETGEQSNEKLLDIQNKIRRSMLEVFKALKIDHDLAVVRTLSGSSFRAYNVIMERILKQNGISATTAGKLKDGSIYGVEKFIKYLEKHDSSIAFHKSVLNTINHDIASRFAPVLAAPGFPPSFEQHFKSEEATGGGTYSSMVEVSPGETVDAIVTSIKVVWYGDGLDDIARRYLDDRKAKNPKEADIYDMMDPNQMAELMRWSLSPTSATISKEKAKGGRDETAPSLDKGKDTTETKSKNVRSGRKAVTQEVATNSDQDDNEISSGTSQTGKTVVAQEENTGSDQSPSPQSTGK